MLGATGIVREFTYETGRTDVVTVSSNGDVLAFEAKLTKWRDALHQAYRNTRFAHQSFVVVPTEIATRASRFAAEFERRGVGLCAVQDGRIVIVHAAARTEPLQPWLSAIASDAARTASAPHQV